MQKVCELGFKRSGFITHSLTLKHSTISPAVGLSEYARPRPHRPAGGNMRDDFTTLFADWLEHPAISPIVVRQGDVNKNSSWDCIEGAGQTVADVKRRRNQAVRLAGGYTKARVCCWEKKRARLEGGKSRAKEKKVIVISMVSALINRVIFKIMCLPEQFRILNCCFLF